MSAAARIITAIDAEQARLQTLQPSTTVGNGSVSVTEIEGGLARNIIPDKCSLYIGRRTSPGEDPAEIQTHLEALIRSNAVPLDVQIENTYGTGSPAFYQDPSSDLVTALSHIAGTSPDTADYGSNALRYPEIASEIVVFGPGSIDQAHQAVEWIDLDQLDLAASIYRKFFNS
ncbi:MAG: acetylornithine deacetylase/succinyl-diaminopimelate desuccinylase-like protein [Candidatus Poriferisodalaceae bacterium]